MFYPFINIFTWNYNFGNYVADNNSDTILKVVVVIVVIYFNKSIEKYSLELGLKVSMLRTGQYWVNAA